jgi:WD40 repeat protein
LHDGKRLVSGNSDNTVRVWDASTGASLRTYKLPDGAESVMIALTADERWIASANNDGSTSIWDFAEGQQRIALIPLLGPKIAFSEFGGSAAEESHESTATARYSAPV